MKRILSAILSIAMIMGIFPAVTFAEDNFKYDDGILENVTVNDKSTLPTFSLELFDMDMNPTTTDAILEVAEKYAPLYAQEYAKQTTGRPAQKIQKAVAAAKAGLTADEQKLATFYIGIKAKNFDKFQAMNQYGLTSFYLPLNYNPDYFIIEPTKGSSIDNAAITGRVTSTYTDEAGLFVYPKNTAVQDAGGTYAEAHTLSIANAYNNTTANQQVQITIKNPQDNADLSGSMYPEEYVAFIEVQLQQKDGSFPESTKVFSFATENQDKMTLGFGSGDTGTSYGYNGTDKHLEYYLVLDESNTNFFPTKYTVTYDANGGSFKNNDDGSTFDNTESVAEGSNATLKKNNVDISSMLNPPTDNEIFEGWYTATTGGTKVDADNPLTVTEPTTLYAHYTTGYKVTFKLNADDASFADGKNTDKEFKAGTSESIIPTGKTLADLIGATDPARTDTDYQFVGWYTKKSNGSFDEEYDATKIDALRASTVLYAMWNYTGATSNTLTFDKNTGDTEANPQTVGYNDGDTLKKLLGGLPQEPTKAGYKFLGWYKNASGDGTRLTADDVLNTYTDNNTKTTVYARWGDVTEQPDDPDTNPPTPSDDAITVHFATDGDAKYNGGTYDYGTVNDKYISEGDPIGAIPTSADMKKDNMKFDGWYTKDVDTSNPAADKGTKVESTTTINAAGLGAGVINNKEVTLYPHWIDKVAVEYDLNGLPGGTAPAKVEGLPGEVKFTPPTAANVTGVDTSKYEIVAWSTKANNDSTASDYKTFTPGTEQTLNDNMKLYAIWNYIGADKVAVTFKGNDSTQKAATLNPNNTTPTNEYTIYRAPQSTITADQMPSASRDSYTFNHWNSDKTAAAIDTTTASQPAITVTGTVGKTDNDPMDIYAIWTVADGVTKHTVSFNLNDSTDKPATPASIASIEVADGDSIGSRMPNNPTRTGYGFKEWQNSNDNSKFDKDTVVNGDVTAKAIWEEEVTVQYNVNGLPGATAPDSVTGTPNSSTKFTPPTAANVTGVDTTKYEIVAWSTSPNNDSTATDYKTFTPGTEQTLTESLTLYAIWNYTGSDKVEVVFNGNGTSIKQATLSPNNGSTDTDKYTIYRQPGTQISADHMPTATRDSYAFNHWDTNSMAAAAAAQPTITVAGTANATNNDPMNIYAIWTVDTANGATEITISYDLNGAKTPTSIDSFKIASGDCVGSHMTNETPTKDNSDFLGWAKNTVTEYSEANKFNVNEALTADTTIKAFFQDKVTITFNANGGTVDTSYTANPSLDDITIPADTAVKDNKSDPKSLPKVTKDKYAFQGWFYEDSTSHQLVELKDDSTVAESVTVTAKWKGDIDVNFDQTEFAHDGSAKTPLTAGNYTVDLLDQAALNDKTKADKDVNIAGLTISTKYKVKGADNSTATATVPTDIGVYELVDTTATCSDQYTEYAVHAIPTEFKITAQVSYVVSGNYQYDASKTKTSFTNITIEEAAGTTYNPNLDFTNANSDIKVTFTDVNDNTKKFVNQMPNAYGEYSITIEPSDNSPYEINQVTDKLTTATNPKLYLICLTRTIKYEFGAQATPTSDTVDIVLPTPNPVNDISKVKTTLTENTKALPVESTDFTPPEGKRLSSTKPFETRATGETEGNGTEFKANTDILWGMDDLVVYALYEDADWTITFKDIKTTDKQNDIVYTVEAGKKISEANAVKKVDGNAPASAVTDVASVTKVPENMKFIGWTKTQQIATDALAGTYKAADFAAADTVHNTPAGQHYDKLFTNESLPAANETKIDVYAIYVKSNDATLKAANFKEILVDKDNDGNPTGTETEKDVLPYTNADYTTPTTPITFDPDTDTYTIVVENDFEKVLANLEPTQPGSVIKITANGTEIADAGYTSGNRSQKSAVSATTYDGTKNSVNTIVATVTAPDGTTKDYTFNVLRYAKAEIKLNYGNSPYAEIERAFGPKDSMSDAEKTAAEQKVKDAKADFIKANKYTAAYVPEAFKNNMGNIYTPEAWVGEYLKNDDGQPVKDLVNKELDTELIAKISNPEINLDRNLYTIFAYGRQDFNDTGFTATDSMGKDVSNSVERSIEIKRVRKFNRNYKVDPAKLGEDVETFTFTDGSVQDLSNITKDKEVDGETDPMLTRPGIYDLVYTFTDPTMPADKQEVSITRKVVVIPKLGDVNMYNDIDPADATDIYAQCKGVGNIINKTTAGDIESLFLYRVVDVNHINGVDPADTTNIYAHCKGIQGSIKEMYKITQ